ncbi:histidinol-phosphate aminotransferase [Kitasatospora sp. MMS16-BH015]|uniref:histidinol-phosphate transaminase n=1 Tax=Kitasatospora sp. MMS16-BH015 TaxID=2018025 RepID=UPI000CA255A8|nr:histidinol-phosphate transaminase [Kitasatospora sp. MMS16-BH015]AUG76124.1 histidinol-phosphate aminotransferase [Kitasatospora sp. MMS16-BH015]
MPVRTRPDLYGLAGFKTVPIPAGTTELASNELPFGPLGSVRAAVARAAGGVHRYPDNSGRLLRECLADRFGAPVTQVSLGAGSIALCLQLAQLTSAPGDEILFPRPSFEAYSLIARTVGATARPVPLRPDGRVDLVALAAAVNDRTRLVFVCTPNNPTGGVLGRAELEKFFDAVPEDVLIVLDEAYWEFVRYPDALDGMAYVRDQAAAGRDNLVALRTFSKAFGLAGMRIGYSLSSEDIAERLRRLALPYSVGTVAQAAAVASLEADQELRQRCDEVVEQRELLRGELVGLGYRVPESGANFLWLGLGRHADLFRQHCLERRVLVKSFPGEGVRVTVGNATENDRFLSAVREFELPGMAS